jgi:hypothetical protein
MVYCSLIVYQAEKEGCFMEMDKEMVEILREDFSVLNENNRKKSLI